MSAADIVRREPHCQCCGYCLVGLESHRCPECGREFNPEDESSFSPRFLDGRAFLRSCFIATLGMLLSALIVSMIDAIDFWTADQSPWIRNVLWTGAVVVLGIALPLSFMWTATLVMMGIQNAGSRRCIVENKRSFRIGMLLMIVLCLGPFVGILFRLFGVVGLFR